MPKTPTPTDVFTRQVQPAINRGRRAIADVGLRRYRVFFYTRQWPDAAQLGDPTSSIVEEITPTPRVEFMSGAKIAASGGLLELGAVKLSKIRGDFTEEQLRGKTELGDDLPDHWHFSYALIAKGARAAHLFLPSRSRPIQHPTEWEILLNPANIEDAKIPIPPDEPSTP